MGHAAGQAIRTNHLHAVVLHGLTGLAQFAVAALNNGQINDHSPRAHCRHHGAGDQHRRWPSGNLSRADHYISLIEVLAQAGPLGIQERHRGLLGVAA